MLNRIVSLFLITQLILFNPALLNFTSIAQAQILDPDLVAQYRTLLVQLTQQYPALADAAALEQAVVEFEANGLDSPETRDFVQRAQGFLSDSDSGLNALLKRMDSWETQEKSLNQARWVAEARTQPSPRLGFLSVGHVCLIWTGINIVPMLLGNLLTCISGCLQGHPVYFTNQFPPNLNLCYLPEPSNYLSVPLNSTCPKGSYLVNSNGITQNPTALNPDQSVAICQDLTKLHHYHVEAMQPGCKTALIATTSIWLGPIVLAGLAYSLKNLPQKMATAKSKRKLKEIEAEKNRIFEELDQRTRLPLLREILTVIAEESTRLREIVVEPQKICGDGVMPYEARSLAIEAPNP
jgi:hypothetical protein